MSQETQPASTPVPAAEAALNPLAGANDATLVLATREALAIREAMALAAERPRDEMACRAAALAAMSRPGMRDRALFEFPRGGQKVTGPSVHMARELGRLWGHLHSQMQIVERTEDYCRIVVTVIDLQTNNREMGEAEFDLKVQRKVYDPDLGTKVTKWVPADERDARELINKQAALLERNCKLRLIPADLVEDCSAVARGADPANLGKDEGAPKAIAAFKAIGVSVARLEEYLERPQASWDATDLQSLRRAYASIQGGDAAIEDYFPVEETEQASTADGKTSDVDEMRRKLQDEQKGAEPWGDEPGGETGDKTELFETGDQVNDPEGQ